MLVMWYTIEAGCPWGAILSPFLFNSMIIVILPPDDAVQVLSYADDITLVL